MQLPWSNNEVWITDGTTGGTTKIVTLSDSSLFITGLQFDQSIPGDEHVYLTTFQSLNNAYTSQLVRFDLQSQLTTILVSSDQGSNAIELGTLYQGRLIFRLTDAEHGTELWYSDGAPETTALWMDINAGPENSTPANFTVDGESLYFFATSAETGTEVWLLNDKNSLPQVIDIISGTMSSDPNYFGFADGLYLNSLKGNYRLSGATATFIPDNPSPAFSSPVPIQGEANKLYFHTAGGDLKFYDGTNVQNVRKFGGISTFLGATNGNVLFVADDEISGLSIWKSDGTELGTSLVLNPEPGTASSYPVFMTNISGNLAYFTSDNPYYNQNYNSDLLQVTGTNEVQLINSGFELIDGGQAAVVQNGFQYQTMVGSFVQIARWDGSGISILTNVTSPAAPLPPTIELNGQEIVFLTNDNSAQLLTIRVDGVEAQHLASFDAVSTIRIREVAGKVYFLVYDNSIRTFRTWRTYGTVDGTIPLSQLSPEFGGGNIFYSGDLVFTDTRDYRGMVFLDGATDQVTVVGNPNNEFRNT